MAIKDINLYYVGGVVRDEFLGVKSLDIDFCYEGNAIDFAKELNVIKVNPDFGTVRIDSGGAEIDIASTRIETYPKAGHLPVVEKIGCPLKEDLARRDFTINAMAKNTITGEIIDFCGGQNDIKNKKLRVLHNRSFIDDPSRIIRGLKFSMRFGFDLEEETLDLQNKYLSNINYDMSYHRLKKELKETFNLNRDSILEEFINKDIFKLLGKNQVRPNILGSANRLIENFGADIIWLVYIGMFDFSNFELTAEEALIIEKYNEIKEKTFNNDIEIYKAFSVIPKESVMIYGITTDYETAWRYFSYLSKIKINTKGSDLKNLGIKQGKIYSEIFNYLLEQKIKQPELTKNAELELVRNFLKTEA